MGLRTDLMGIRAEVMGLRADLMGKRAEVMGICAYGQCKIIFATEPCRRELLGCPVARYSAAFMFYGRIS